MPSNETTARERPTGRYYAQHVRLNVEKEPQEELREVLDAGDMQEWHLVGVASLPDAGVLLFWDTRRPSFGRSSV